MSSSTYPKVANPQLAAAMRELRRSSAASRHTDRHAQAKKGHNARGGRAGVKNAIIKEMY